MNKSEELYREARERLKAGKSKYVDKTLSINELDTVALEAGKKKGSLRKANLPNLCAEILEFEIKASILEKYIRQKDECKKIAE